MRTRIKRKKEKNNILLPALIVLAFFVFIALVMTALPKKSPAPRPKPAYKGRIAIVIDDWGYSLNNLAIIKEIKQPLTCAVLPNLKDSALIAKKLNNLGFEIILHLPMQPKEKCSLEKNTILLNMNASRVSSIINHDLSSLVFVKGVSNHMGSAITENKKLSTMVLTEVKKHKLYFLDSFVSSKSTCQVIAKNLRLKFAKRDIFLDNINDPEYIREQLVKLKELSRKQGVAIGIGHDRKNTLMVLKSEIPQLEKQGYKFVFVSELAK